MPNWTVICVDCKKPIKSVEIPGNQDLISDGRCSKCAETFERNRGRGVAIATARDSGVAVA